MKYIEFKVGDPVIYINKKEGEIWKGICGFNLYKKIGKIIAITDEIEEKYLIAFKEYIGCFWDTGEFDKYRTLYKKKGHCVGVQKEDIKLYLNSLKLKKFIKHGV